jgi:hypothetical protein
MSTASPEITVFSSLVFTKFISPFTHTILYHLNYPKQLDLHTQGHLPNLIRKYGPRPPIQACPSFFPGSRL